MDDNYEKFKSQMPEWVKNEADFELYKLRHSTEHIFNQAVEELFPGKIVRAMGPAIQDGWYNDSRWEVKPSEEDFEKIEARMKEIVKMNLPFVYKEVSEAEAREMFKDNPFKQEFIDEFVAAGSPLSVYYTGDPAKGTDIFVDLCRGPHVDWTSKIKAFKLLSIAGAYWRGDEKNEMLTRVYGTTFANKEQLEEYLTQLEEAKKRDHRDLGPKLDLFMFHETAPGMPYWLPGGLSVYNELVGYWRKQHNMMGYKEIASPLINKSELWEISGHWEHYKDDMFIANMGENEIYGIKPMNCPNAMLVFKSKQISYRDLPYRLSDTDRLHRYERSGTLNGLLRVRSFQQDDSHNFISEDMISSEYKHIFSICEDFYSLFGLSYSFRMGTRPEGFLGDIETWDKAEAELKSILEKSGKEYYIKEGDGAFYGPKIDILMHDALGREWQMGTIQLDFQLPRRFELFYIDKNGQKQTPVVVHRVIYGSLERFIGILTEHFAGAFPSWIAPEQVRVIPISDQNLSYAKEVYSVLLDNDIRTTVDDSDDRLGNKIRKGQSFKVPYMLIIGKEEVENKTVSVRLRSGAEIKGLAVDDFLQKLKSNIANKKLELDLD